MNEATGPIGLLMGKTQNDSRDPGEVLPFLRHHSIIGNLSKNSKIPK